MCSISTLMSIKEPETITVPIKGELRRRVKELAKIEKRSLGRQIELMISMGIDEFERISQKRQKVNESKDGGAK